MDYVCGFALGDVKPGLAEDILITLPETHLPGWSVRSVAETTDRLLDLTQQYEQAPWTTLVVTPWLTGGVSLEKTLVLLRKQWPDLRIAVVLGQDTPRYRQMITTLAEWRIYNCLVGIPFGFDDMVSLITTDYTWEDVAPYLVIPGDLGAPPEDTLPMRLSDRAAAVTAPVGPSHTVAVISAQGRSGKTGFVANMVWASAAAGSIALDMDFGKPALPLYFRAADNPYPVQLQHLLAGLSPHADEQLTPQDKQEIREYLHQAVEVTPGARLVPGPLRHHAMTPPVPATVMTAMIREAKHSARWVWVDTPTPQDPLWDDLVRSVDQVIILTPTDSVGILETLALLERLARLRVPPHALHVVVNRLGKGGHSPDAIAQVHLQRPVWAIWPDQSTRWEAAMQAHRPMAAKDLAWWRRLVDRLADEAETEESTPPMRRKILGRKTG